MGPPPTVLCDLEDNLEFVLLGPSRGESSRGESRERPEERAISCLSK